MAFKDTAQVHHVYFQWLISTANPMQTQALEMPFSPPVRAEHAHHKDHPMLDLFPVFFPAVISSSSSLPCHFTFLLFLHSCDTKQYFHSNTTPNKQEKHSLICMWPRFPCFLQFTLIACLLGFHIKENIPLMQWELSCSLPPRTTYLWKHLALQASNSSFFFYVTYINGNGKLVCHKTHFTS